MAVYAIGDIQGCHGALLRLLDHIGFDRARDRLWFTGDLVNRGPDSLAALRAVMDLGDAAVTVLGNHDLHLLAVAAGHARLKRADTIAEVLNAPDAPALVEWLRHRPLLHHDARLGYALVHAGLAPQWTLARAIQLAREVETALRGERYAEFFAHMYGDEPDRWDDRLAGWDRLRVITNSLTRLRYCDATGRMALQAKGAPGTQPAGFMPWFEVPTRASRDTPIVFGHWSTLPTGPVDGGIALDSGCLWGGRLTAARLRPAPVKFFSVGCERYRRPGTPDETEP